MTALSIRNNPFQFCFDSQLRPINGKYGYPISPQRVA